MARSFMWRIGVALLGALALVTGAHAGGWSVVVLDRASAAAVGNLMQPGVPFEVGFTVLQHGTRPVADLAPTIVLTPRGGGAPIEVGAVAQGEPGHYVATVTLPEAGVWRWEIDAFGPPSVMAPITVAAPPAPAAPASPVPLVVLALAGAALGLLGLRARSGRVSAAAPR